MILQQIFITNLKKFRKERGISQMALSRMCDTSTNYIGQIEMGRRIPSFEKIEQIAAALEIPSYRLFIYEVEKIDKVKELTSKEYLKKMPAKVKSEIISRLTAAINKEIVSSLDSRNH
jgi:transcriptional regulator with XRE-family HTH domain